MLDEALAAGPHIVVCDDEPDIRDTLSEYLEGNGYAVTPADAGPALRELLDTQHVDVVILDLRMPGEDGLSLARYMREHFDVAIIMLTGSAGIITEVVVGLEIGADDYIAKPVDLRELLARVKAVLRRTSGHERTTGKTEIQGAARSNSAIAASSRAHTNCSMQREWRLRSRRWSSNS